MIFLGLRVLVVPAGPGMNVLTCGLVDALRLHIEEPGREIDAGELFDLLFLKEGLGDKFLAISIALFAFATIIGWAYFGERTAAYLFGEHAVFPYKLIYILLLLPGAVLAPKLVWELSDTFNGLMAIPNLTALILLHGEVIRMAKEYKRNRK